MALRVVLALFFLATCASIAAGPIHASCKLTWSFTTNCTFVHNALKSQINKWTNDPKDCNSTERCLYKLTSDSADELKATHSTPVKHYVDDLTFNFESASGSCTIAGYSTSETWYAVLDYGTNYCNMHNLVVGAGINTAQYGFKEMTSDSQCTEYSSANCDKY